MGWGRVGEHGEKDMGEAKWDVGKGEGEVGDEGEGKGEVGLRARVRVKWQMRERARWM